MQDILISVDLSKLVSFADNSDLNLKIDGSGVKAHPLTVEGFAFMWSGARATYGVGYGKVAFEVKVRAGVFYVITGIPLGSRKITRATILVGPFDDNIHSLDKLPNSIYALADHN
jgi:hypothetical protein